MKLSTRVRFLYVTSAKSSLYFENGFSKIPMKMWKSKMSGDDLRRLKSFQLQDFYKIGHFTFWYIQFEIVFVQMNNKWVVYLGFFGSLFCFW